MSEILKRRLRNESKFDNWMEDSHPDRYDELTSLVTIKEKKSLTLWIAYIHISNSTGKPYELEITFPENYPFKGPQFRLLTKFDHGCVGDDGTIEIWKANEWSPALTIRACVLIIISCLFPNLNEEFVKERQTGRTSLIKEELFQKIWVNPYANIDTSL